MVKSTGQCILVVEIDTARKPLWVKSLRHALARRQEQFLSSLDHTYAAVYGRREPDLKRS